MFTLLLPVVLLNLLISVIADTFDYVSSNRTPFDYKERAQIILEIETMIRWRQSSKKAQLLYRFIRQGSNEDWDGKVNIIRKEIKDARD